MFNGRGMSGRRTGPDVHELLKGEILSQSDATSSYVEQSFTTSSPIVSSTGAPVLAPQPTSSQYGTEDIHIYFDSANNSSAANVYSSGILSWQIAPLNFQKDIKNCVILRINSFWFPRSLGFSASKPDQFYYRRVFLAFTSLPSVQMVQAANGKQYHFELEVEQLTSDAVFLRPINDTIVFPSAINNITELVGRFMIAPNFDPINLPPPIVAVQSVPGTNPMQFKMLQYATTEVLGPIGVPTAPGIAVQLSGYQSTSVGINNAVNDKQGNFVSNIIDAETFEISGIDGSGLGSIFSASMTINRNRVAFQVRFTSLKAGPTNYIQSVNQ